MKKLLLSIISTATIFISGCITPTVESVTITSTTIGVAAGTVVSQTDLDETTSTNIVKILYIVSSLTPETNSTFVSTWTPTVNKEIQKLLDNGEIDIYKASIIRTAVLLAAEGVDYMFFKHPDWALYLELTEAAVHGFIGGYIDAVDMLRFNRSTNDIVIDADAYIYMKKKLKCYKK